MISDTPAAANPSRTLLITVGSTLFPSLTDQALTTPFLLRLIQLRVQSLIIQYGKADLTLPPDFRLVSQGTQHGSGIQNFSYQPKDISGEGEEGRDLRVGVLRYTDDFEALVRSAKWVISHAGAGSILTVLRTPRPLLVIPNSDLMDNHQAQLADALGRPGGDDEGYLLVSTVEDLIDNLPRLIDDDYRPKPFPPVDHSKFRNILDRTAGYAI